MSSSEQFDLAERTGTSMIPKMEPLTMEQLIEKWATVIETSIPVAIKNREILRSVMGCAISEWALQKACEQVRK